MNGENPLTKALIDIEREIETLEGTMGNGASGGTAWMRHNVKRSDADRESEQA